MKFLFTIILFAFSINAFGQSTNKPTDTILSIKPEIASKILSASTNGGDLDFWTPIKGHEYDGQVIQTGASAKDKVVATKKEIAVIQWAYNLTKIGIKRSDIILLYGELKKRKIRDDEIKLLDLGINKQ